MKRSFIPMVGLALIPLFSVQDAQLQQAERWIAVQIINIREGIPDDRGNPSFEVTVDVQMAGCERATIDLTSTATVDGSERSWKTNDSFSVGNQGRTQVQRKLLVSESSLRNPSPGFPISFSVNGRGYYKVKELQQVEYIEYVPVTHTTPGYVVPGGGHHSH